MSVIWQQHDCETRRRRWRLWCQQPLRRVDWVVVAAWLSAALLVGAVWRVVWLWVLMPLLHP